MPSRVPLILAAVLAVMCGCAKLDLMPFFDKDEARRKNVREAIRGEGEHSRLIGDYIKIADSTLGMIKVQGVGLVDRLDGTGEDPPASPYRTRLLEDIRRHEIQEPQALLRSANTALVIVTAYIPPIVKKGDQIDVEVQFPPGSEAKSLRGGWLMPCYLNEHALIAGQVKQGREIASASGAILIDALGDESDGVFSGHRKGRIPAGATYVGDDRHLKVAIGSEYRTVRMCTQIANRIGRRFHDYDEHGIQRPLATAKEDSYFDLIVHERYRDNYPRYLQVIRGMSLSESPVERHLRMQQLSEAIQFGPTAERASLQLEAIGPEAIPLLKTGLTSSDLEARFHSAMALAYLNNTDGVPSLKEAAEREPAFRIFALAALASLDDGSAAEALRDLMNVESIETRYGAFRALETMAPNDPYIQGVEMDGNFWLHPVESEARPLIHLTRFKKAEIVVFGDNQELMPPVILRAGNRIVIRSASTGDQIVVKRISAGEQVQERLTSKRVVDVIQAASELGAQYPDIVEMLVQAKNQHNLTGDIAIDEMPRPGRVYRRSGPDEGNDLASSPSSVQVGSSGLTPNLFDERPENRPVAPSEPENDSNPEKPSKKKSDKKKPADKDSAEAEDQSDSREPPPIKEEAE
ncbi:MAG: flagellar basal body P-ring protein FlgI [Planctomycetaceae bacterium]|nr:flagellar basal body P-ring protein FlgI [Planctomycetaceae bacterium]